MEKVHALRRLVSHPSLHLKRNVENELVVQ